MKEYDSFLHSKRIVDKASGFCPLQLDVIERSIHLWTNPGDVVLDPFSGIGSTVYCAAKMGRYGIGIELKESYWKQSIKNLMSLSREEQQTDLFAACN